MKKKRHHYVWQKYLQPFCYQNNMIYCLYEKRVKGISTKDIAVEKNIYRLNELSSEEIDFLLKLFEVKDITVINEINRYWVKLFNAVFETKNTSLSSNAKEDNKRKEIIQNLCEDLHMKIEKAGLKFLDKLYNKDVSFYDNDIERANFLLFIMIQYSRTKKMRDAISSIDGKGHIDFKNAWNVIVFIMSTSVGTRIFNEKSKWELKILDNKTSIPFITSDQPIINIYAKNTKIENTKLSDDEFELYYPVSPVLAVVLKKKGKAFIDYNTLNDVTINYLNVKMQNESHLQVFSNTESYLNIIKNA